MKDKTFRKTSLPWILDCPERWDLVRLKYLVSERVQKGFPDEPLLTASQSHGVIEKKDYGTRTVEAQKDLHLLKLVEPGDYVISLRSFQGGIEYAHKRGIISPAYTILRPGLKVHRGYFEHYFKSSPFVSSMTLFVTGIREGQNIDYVRLSRAYMPVPPIEEQERIGRFVRHLDSKVNRLSKAKRRLIELLNEQKQAIIHQAVIRGLDPTVPLKPSGVDWLGEVPAHWRVARLRTLATKFGSGVTPRGGAQGYVEDGIPLLRSQNIHFDGLRLENVARIPLPVHEEMSGSHVHPQDVLLNITGASLGRVCSVPDECGEMNVNQHVCIIRPKRALVQSTYLAMVLGTPSAQDELDNLQNGASREGLPLRAIKGLAIPVPPIEDQEAIQSAVLLQTSTLRQAIRKAQSEIELIREYRTRLVADVVTGQLDVRNVEIPALDDELNDIIDDPANDELEDSDEILEEVEV